MIENKIEYYFLIFDVINDFIYNRSSIDVSS